MTISLTRSKEFKFFIHQYKQAITFTYSRMSLFFNFSQSFKVLCIPIPHSCPHLFLKCQFVFEKSSTISPIKATLYFYIWKLIATTQNFIFNNQKWVFDGRIYKLWDFEGHSHNCLMISTQKKIWSEEEDQILKHLFQDQGMRNWSSIAKKMASEYNLPRKSAKQCRERYENHINMETAKVEWTIEEQICLIQYHNEIGNKWSVIAQKIPGKSDNCIKNHFYSKLRKVLRKLNAIIHAYFRRQFREININVIYKIVEACEQLFKQKPNCEHSISLACRQVQNKMLNLSMLKEEQFDSQDRVKIYRQVIKQIYSVSKLYKRKSKKSRNSSIQAPNIKMKHKKAVTVLSNNIEQGYESEPQSSYRDSQQQQNSIKRQAMKQEFQEELYHVQVSKPKNNDVVIKDQEQGIKDLLKDAGILQIDQSEAHSVNGFKFSSSKSSFKSYSEKNDSDQQFFEDSDGQKNFYKKSRRGSLFRFIDNPSQRSQGQGLGESFFNN